ncbi:cysteine hydrolase [Microbacterium sp. STN6]|uniref:cysteine hydrolase family protein n=1 Tax=Microbacterium sp. STN6 TaxID=2995588 RepID=UPI002260C164|nr:isochorismatase family cysteine hydrolase [Microbacterium sp. STN6]MCX7522023.1 cysteine hydrolase [Microbacterium sp. STN6]
MTHTHPVDPAQTALLIMDLQPSILERVPDQQAFLASVTKARDAARAAGLHVVYVRAALSRDDAVRVPASNAAFAQAAASGRLDAGRPETQVDSRIEPTEGELVVCKTRVGAFSSASLDATLRERGVDTLALCGISTSGVVLSTVRDGADRDYRLFVLDDACFDVDPEVHRVLTQKVFPRQASVMSVADFEGLLTAG